MPRNRDEATIIGVKEHGSKNCKIPSNRLQQYPFEFYVAAWINILKFHEYVGEATKKGEWLLHQPKGSWMLVKVDHVEENKVSHQALKRKSLLFSGIIMSVFEAWCL
jgi:hypothetical protein